MSEPVGFAIYMITALSAVVAVVVAMVFLCVKFPAPPQIATTIMLAMIFGMKMDAMLTWLCRFIQARVTWQ